MEGEEKPLLGRRVAVYGGGNTAMDVARTARRLGATEAVVVYRRTRDRMPAHDFEVEEAEEEGVRMKWLSTVKRAEAGVLTIERMELDENGFPQPTGELEELEADSLVLALGQESDLALLDGVPGIAVEDGVVQVGAEPHDRAAGDLRRRRHGAGRADGDRRRRATGRRRRRHIDAWLRAGASEPAPKHAVAEFDELNTWYYADAPRSVQPTLELARRELDVRGGRRRAGRDDRALRGAPLPLVRQLLRLRQLLRRLPRQRGDQARGARREAAGRGYAIDYDFCKGCGICAAECPCGAIEMVPEAI